MIECSALESRAEHSKRKLRSELARRDGRTGSLSPRFRSRPTALSLSKVHKADRPATRLDRPLPASGSCRILVLFRVLTSESPARGAALSHCTNSPAASCRRIYGIRLTCQQPHMPCRGVSCHRQACSRIPKRCLAATRSTSSQATTETWLHFLKLHHRIKYGRDRFRMGDRLDDGLSDD